MKRSEIWSARHSCAGRIGVFAVSALFTIGQSVLWAGNANMPEVYIVMSSSDFNAVNSASDSTKVKRKCRVQFKYPGQSSYRFDVQCEIRNHGGIAVHKNQKRSFRLKFTNRYSAGDPMRLNYPVFEKAPVHAGSAATGGFNNLVLRGGGNEQIQHPRQPPNWPDKQQRYITYLKDSFTRSLQIDMSGKGVHGTFCHLYVNRGSGDEYWGLYGLCERPDHSFASQYYGGHKNDWCSQRGVAGTLSRWNSMFSSAKAGNFDETAKRLDMAQFVDYVILNMYMGVRDWSNDNSWDAMREDSTGKGYWFCWDSEFALNGGGDGYEPTAAGAETDIRLMTRGNQYHDIIWNGLIGNSKFQAVINERAWLHLKNGGALTDARVTARFDVLRSFIKDDDFSREVNRWSADKNYWNLTTWKSHCSGYRSLITGVADRLFTKMLNKGWVKSTPPGGDPPAAPSSLVASAASSSRVGLSWKDTSSNESGFKIDRSTTGSSGWVRIAEPGANATSCTDSGLTAGTTYYYKVKAYNEAGHSGYSNTADATTPPAIVPKIALSTTSVSVSCEQGEYAPDKTFQVWNGGTGTLRYNVVETSSTMEISPTSGSSTGAADKKTHTISFPRNDLAVGTHNKTITIEDNGSGAANGPLTIAVAITVTEPQLQPPAAPSNLAAAAGSSSKVALAWADNSDNEDSFKVDRRTSGTQLWARIATPAANTTAVTDSGLASSTSYYYKVKAWNTAGNSPYSSVAAVTTPAAAPAQPSGLALTVLSSTAIKLTWQDKSFDETGFKVRRRTDGVDFSTWSTAPAADATSYTDTGLRPGTTYYYKIKATGVTADSAYTTPVGAATSDMTRTEIAKGSTWRYRAGAPDADGWITSGFDDSGWTAGAAPFGYGDGPYGTTISDMQNSYSGLLLRKTFNVGDPSVVRALELRALYDDGFVVWINGAEAARHNVPGAAGTAVACDALASATVGDGTEWTATLTGSTMPALADGINVVAVQVLNGTLKSSDLTWDLELSVVVEQLSAAEDPDADDLPDSWEESAFGDAVTYDGDDDPDGDDMSNREEYIAGTDALGQNRYLALAVGRESGRVVVSCPTVAASGPGYEGCERHYAIEFLLMADGAAWTAVPGYADILGANQTLTYTETAATDVPVCYRAKVWLVGP
ncbi:MAG: fibronectin type III domain-containing protein [Kiritimatiellae bacterium]|nr:fibronectin type III domain-containing protein [Kiritimatiellia bacterium]